MLDSLQSGQLASRDLQPRSECRSAQCKSAQSTSASWCSISRASRFWRPFPAWPAKSARLLSRRPHGAMVGAGLLDRRDGDFHTHDHRHARDCLRRKPGLSATGAGLPGGAGDSLRGPYPTIFPGRILHGLPASGKALRRADEVRGGRGVYGHARAGGGRADFGDRKSGERGVWHGRSRVDSDYHCC